ncbi:MAG: transcriptional regulator NrdR [Deltaproteobacteria bacterium]|nr:transcriptional regulator NrdR [Deltaproteobacteria bacterium]
MKCPFCSYADTKVIDSRLCQGGESIRRRRECFHCEDRFTTYERVEKVLPLVIKRDGSREPFDRNKVYQGIAKACEKRPVSSEKIEGAVDAIEKELMERGEKELHCKAIGEAVLKKLHQLDDVAYIRFASVYRQFRDINEFTNELNTLLQERQVKHEQTS